MMSAPWTEKISSDRSTSVLWAVLAGIVIGSLFLAAAQLDQKWFIVLFLTTLSLFVALGVPDVKSFFLVVLALSLPINTDLNVFFQASSVRRSTYGFQILLSHLPLVPLYLIWGLSCVVHKRPLLRSSTGLVLLAAFLLICFASVLGSREPLFGFFDLFALTGSVLLFVYVANEIEDARELRLIFITLIALVGLQGVIAVGQYVTGSSLGLEILGGYRGSGREPSGALGLAWISRVAGTLGHPNQLALFFDLLLPLALSFTFFPMQKRYKLMLIAGMSLGLLGLLATFSRGGITSVGLAFFSILLVRFARLVGIIRSGIWLLLLLMFVGLLTFGTSNPLRDRFLEHRYDEALARIPLAKVTLKLIRDNPLLGVGLNNFTSSSKHYDTTREQITAVWNAPVHNIFLFIAAETGIVGLVLFIGFLLRTMVSLSAAIRSSDPFLQAAGTGLLTGFLAYLAHAQIDYSDWTHFPLLWFLLGLAVATRRLAGQGRESAEQLFG